MGTGYTRNDTSNNIADGNIINAADLDGEFDAIESAFGTSGHTHDGTSAEGGPITVLGPVQDFIASATEIKPKTTNTLDIGTSALLFKDLFLDGVATLGSIKIDNDGTIGSASDSDAIAISSGGVVTFSQAPLVDVTNSTTNAVTDVLGIQVQSSGTPAVGIGSGFTLGVETAAGNVETGGAIRIVSTGLTPTDEEIDLVFYSMRNGSLTEAFRFDSSADSLSLNDSVDLSLGSDDDLVLVHSGTQGTVTNSTGNLTFDVAGDIILDADGGDIRFRDDGTEVGTIIMDDGSNTFILKSAQSDADIKFNGNDGGSGITALTLDMSEAGNAIFNNNIGVGVTPSSWASTGAAVQVEGAGHLAAANQFLYVGSNYYYDGAWKYTTSSTAAQYRNNAGSHEWLNAASGTADNTITWSERMAIELDGDIRFGSSTDYTFLRPYESSTGNLIISADHGGTGTSGSAIKFRTRGADKMIIEHSGDVGIGTTSPNLHGWTNAVTLDTSTNGAYEIGQSGTKYGAFALQGDGRIQLTNFTANPLTFQTNNTEAMRIDSSGNIVLAGVTSDTTVISLNTSDGSDTKQLSLAGGGADSDGRGARARLYGNEHASKGGDVDISTGNVSGAQMDLTATGVININSGGSSAIHIDASQKVIIGNTVTRGTYGLTVAEPSDGVRIFGIASGGMDALHFDQARGSVASPTASNADGDGSYLSFSSYDGTNFDDIGSLAVVTDGAQDSGRMIFRTTPTGGSQTERMRIDSTGKVLIGTTTQNFSRLNFGQNEYIGFHSGNSAAGGLRFEDNTGLASAEIRFQGTGSNQRAAVVFSTGDSPGSENISEAMRIDSSGNLLIANTDTDPYDNSSSTGGGIALRDTGAIYNAVYQGTPVVSNRIGNDGNILQVRRDGVKIGAIGSSTKSGDTNLYVGSGNVGMYYHDANNSIDPINPADGLDRNGAIDLGRNGVEFKDLYLSGGVVFNDAGGSGTSTSNTLDMYEEGTWTPTLKGSTGNPTVTYTVQKGRYVKVGQIVHVAIDMRWSAQSGGSGNTFIGGFPFQNGDAYWGATIFESSSSWNWGSGRSVLGFEIQQNNTQGSVLVSGTNLGSSSLNISNLGTGSGYTIFSFSYRAAS